MTVPVVESFTAVYASGNDTSIVGAKPTGTVEGDALFAAHGCDGGFVSLTPGAGFSAYSTRLLGAVCAGISYLVAGASEPANYTFTTAASETQILYIARVSGAATPDPRDAFSNAFTGGAFDLDAPSVTTAEDECLVFRVAFKNAAHNDTEGFPDADVTELSLGPTTAGSGNIQAAFAYESQATAGATGTRTYDGGNGSDSIITFTSAFKPGAGGTTTPETVAAALVLTAAVGMVVSFSRAVDAAATFTPTAVLGRLFSRTITATTTYVASVAQEAAVGITVTAGATFDATVSSATTFVHTVSAAATYTAAKVRSISLNIASSLGFTVGRSVSVGKNIAADAVFTAQSSEASLSEHSVSASATYTAASSEEYTAAADVERTTWQKLSIGLARWLRL